MKNTNKIIEQKAELLKQAHLEIIDVMSEFNVLIQLTLHKFCTQLIANSLQRMSSLGNDQISSSKIIEIVHDTSLEEVKFLSDSLKGLSVASKNKGVH